MSYLAIVLTSVFSANVLLVYGLNVCPVFRRERRSAWIQLLALGLVNLLASMLFWAVRTLALAPLGLEALDVVIYAVVITPLLKFLSRFVATGKSPFLVRLGAAMDEGVTSCLVFGVALIVARRDYGLAEALVASLSACLGWWIAVVVLDSIRDRLELSGVPASFRGAPSILLSAGLMALAFMGIDHALVHNLSR